MLLLCTSHVIYEASLATVQRHVVNIAETAIRLRVKAREALQILQRRQRPLTIKVIQLYDFRTMVSGVSAVFAGRGWALTGSPFSAPV